MTPNQTPHDLGAQGPAQLARPSRAYPVAGASTGSASPGVQIVVARYGDTTLHDRMWRAAQVSDRQHQAICRAAYLWHAAGLDVQVTQDYQAVPDVVHEAVMVDHDDDHDPDETAIDRYRRQMRPLSQAHRDAIESVLGGRHPGMGRLATFQAAASALADLLGIERLGVG